MTDKDRFVYHIKTKDFIGDRILPLNQLKTTHRHQYEQHKQKYMNRDFLLMRKIPILNCLWNDVIHCSPINPEILFEHLNRLGYKNPEIDYFKIPVSLVSSIPCMYYQFPESPDSYSENCYSEFSIEKYQEWTDLPESTLQYYKECNNQGKRPLLFAYIDHVLIYGSIPLNRIETSRIDLGI